MKISGCVIAKNEEKNIERCLKSLKEVCDEIVFVDTGSTDNTINIAKKIGAKVYHFKWIDDFSAAKNFALNKAKGDWIIFLDADEYLLETNPMMYKELATKARNFDSVLCEILNVDDNNKIRETHIGNRLFKNRPDIRFVGRIHEDIRKGNEIVSALDGSKYMKIVHTGYKRSEIISKNKFHRNINILMQELQDRHNDPSIYYYIADTYGLIGDYEKQVEYAKKSIAKGKLKHLGFAELPYSLLIKALFKLKKDKKILRYEINKAIREFPSSPLFRYYLGLVDFEEKKYSASLENMLKAIELNRSYNYYSVDEMRQFMYFLYKIVGYIYELKKDYVNAVAMYTKSLKEDSEQKDTLQRLLILLKDEPIDQLIVFLNKIYDVQNINDLEFLIEAAVGVDNGILLSYYQKKLFEISQEGNNAIFLALLYNKLYDEAYLKSLNIYEKTFRYDISLVMILSAIFSENSSYIDSVKKIVKPSLRRIVNNIVEESSNSCLYKVDIKDYVELLSLAVKIGDFKKLYRILNLKDRFEVNICEDIGDVFYKNTLYEYCIEYYKNAAEDKDYSNKGELFKKIAISFYHIEMYNEAVNYFKEAINLGILEYEIYEYLTFIYEKGNEAQRKEIKQILSMIPDSEYILKYIEKGEQYD